MASIQEYLDLIKNAIYGKDVRQAIHDGIQQCYYDGRAGSTDLEARQRLDTAEGSISSLGSRMSTAETDIDVLDSRVDEIVAPSGQAPSAAEVTDARIDADGITYSSLGTANRTQFTNLKHEFSDIADLDILTLHGAVMPHTGFYYNGTSYIMADTSGWGADAQKYMVEIIPIEAGGEYTLSAEINAPYGFTNNDFAYEMVVDNVESVTGGTSVEINNSSNYKYLYIQISNGAGNLGTELTREYALKSTIENLSDDVQTVADYREFEVSGSVKPYTQFYLNGDTYVLADTHGWGADGYLYSVEMIPIENGKTYTLSADVNAPYGFSNNAFAYEMAVDNVESVTGGTSVEIVNSNNYAYLYVGKSNAGAGNLNTKLTANYPLKEAVDEVRTEVADARIGVDGTAYESAGEAVRTQIENLAELRGLNLQGQIFPYTAFYLDGDSYVLADTHYWGDGGDAYSVGMIPIENGKTYTLSADINAPYGFSNNAFAYQLEMHDVEAVTGGTSIEIVNSNNYRYLYVQKSNGAGDLNSKLTASYPLKDAIETQTSKLHFLDDITGIFDADRAPMALDANTTKITDVYSIYDALMSAYPNYITRTVLGVVSPDNLEVRKYVFNSLQIQNDSQYTLKKPKLLFVSGIHGHEQGAPYSLALAIKQIVEGTDDISKFIKDNIEIVLVPIANPYGYNHNQRKNENDVDIERNFSVGWTLGSDPSSEYYGGSSANSEIETQIITNLINDNKDAYYCVDFHNIANGYPLMYLYSDEQAQFCNSLFVTLTNKWRAEYSGFPTNRLLGYCKTGVEPACPKQAISEGIDAFVAEGPWVMPVIGSRQYDIPTLTITSDVFGNIIVMLAKSMT